MCIIKQIRKAQKLDQGEFAKKLGVSQAFVSQCESGKKSPSIEVIKRMDALFGVGDAKGVYQQIKSKNKAINKFCTHCGRVFYHGDNFCGNCGKSRNSHVINNKEVKYE